MYQFPFPIPLAILLLSSRQHLSFYLSISANANNGMMGCVSLSYGGIGKNGGADDNISTDFEVWKKS